MLWVARLSGFVSAAMLVVVLSPSLQSFLPAEAIRSSHLDGSVRFPGLVEDSAWCSVTVARSEKDMHVARWRQANTNR
jgi:hypothetical protein